MPSHFTLCKVIYGSCTCRTPLQVLNKSAHECMILDMNSTQVKYCACVFTGHGNVCEGGEAGDSGAWRKISPPYFQRLWAGECSEGGTHGELPDTGTGGAALSTMHCAVFWLNALHPLINPDRFSLHSVGLLQWDQSVCATRDFAPVPGGGGEED